MLAVCFQLVSVAPSGVRRPSAWKQTGEACDDFRSHDNRNLRIHRVCVIFIVVIVGVAEVRSIVRSLNP